MNSLKQYDYLPEELLTASVETLYRLFPEPSLFHLKGKHERPIFVSVLLHGNEPTGFLALQELLKKYQNKTLPRSLSFFLGNTLAAHFNRRRLETQQDYNRIWKGSEIPDCEETRLANQIMEIMQQRKVFASIDIHNNTGLNPHYACINSLENDFLQLARLFSRLVVYFLRPKGVQSSAFSQLCPSVTLECGRPGQKHGVEHALEYLDSCLHLSEFPKHPVPAQDIDLFHTVAQVKINPEVDFSFSREKAQFLLNDDIEKLNFTEIPKGTAFGMVNDNTQMPVTAYSEEGKNITDNFFSFNNHFLQLKRKTMPSMLTLDERVIKQDCLCYLMERIQL